MIHINALGLDLASASSPTGLGRRRYVLEAIVDTAKSSGCDLVVMASHGLRGVSAILGSKTLKVLTHTSVPILVFR